MMNENVPCTRIGSQIIRGELYNLKRNSVHGWLDVGGDRGVRLELTGNMSGELFGQRVRFQRSQPKSDADCSAEEFEGLENRQCGVTGDMEVRTSDDGKRTLYFEWFSQNGRVIAEFEDPVFEIGPAEEDEETTSADDPPDGDDMLDFPQSADESADGEDDPYGLFPADLDQQLSLASDDDEGPTDEIVDQEPFEPTDGASPPRQTRPWDEVIPGLDPDTKRMYDEWHEVIDGTKDVPFTELFDPPLTLMRPTDIPDEAVALRQLRSLLARLALHCVAIHMCEHFSALETYRWLVDDLLPEEGVHPRLRPTGFVRHYDTSEHCPACEADFEARWNARKQEGE